MSSSSAHDWQTVAGQFGLGEVQAEPVYVARGAMGEIWRLRTTAGQWAVKWQFPWEHADARPADVAVQLAAAEAGIPLPRPVVTPDGAAVVQVGDRQARAYQWMNLGEPLRLPASEPIAAEAGRLLGILHALGLPASEPEDPWYTEVCDSGYWPDLADRVRAAGLTWAAQLAATLPLIAEVSGWAAPGHGGPAIVCHRDFNPDNVFPMAANGQLAVLDWENCGPLDPVRELGYAVYSFCTGGGRFDEVAARALMAGYARTAGRRPEPGPDFFATAVATELNVLQVMAERALAEPDHRSHAETYVADLLDHYLADLRLVTRLWSQAPHSLLRGEE